MPAPPPDSEPGADRPPRLSVVLVLIGLQNAIGIGILLLRRSNLTEQFPRLTEPLHTLALIGSLLAILGAIGVWQWRRWGLPLIVLSALTVFGIGVLIEAPRLHPSLVLILLVGVLWAGKPVLRKLL